MVKSKFPWPSLNRERYRVLWLSNTVIVSAVWTPICCQPLMLSLHTSGTPAGSGRSYGRGRGWVGELRPGEGVGGWVELRPGGFTVRESYGRLHE